MLIVLHGLISHRFEKEIKLNGRMQKDLIVDFLNCKHKNFKTSLKKMAKEGNFYQIIESSGNFHIVPIVGGSVGAVVAALTSQVAQQFLVAAATNLAMAGLNMLISPPEEDGFDGAEDAVVLQSTRFQGLQNVASQGDKVPVGYGRLKVGSTIINQYSENVNVDNSNNISEINDVWGETEYQTPLDFDLITEYLNVTDVQSYYGSIRDDLFEGSYSASDGSNTSSDATTTTSSSTTAEGSGY